MRTGPHDLLTGIKTMKTRTPKDLFFDQIRDLHSVETQLLESLPVLSARAAHPALHELITRHAAETARHLSIVAAILESHGTGPGGDKCKAMEGLIAGGNAHLDGVEVPQTRDLMLVAHCLRIEHYEIAGYGIALRLAQGLELKEEAAALESIIQEEKDAARGLQALEPVLFRIAMEGGLNR